MERWLCKCDAVPLLVGQRLRQESIGKQLRRSYHNPARIYKILFLSDCGTLLQINRNFTSKLLNSGYFPEPRTTGGLSRLPRGSSLPTDEGISSPHL